jgi:hypothetical protein
MIVMTYMLPPQPAQNNANNNPNNNARNNARNNAKSLPNKTATPNRAGGLMRSCVSAAKHEKRLDMTGCLVQIYIGHA